jgi:hypothetical protein
MKRVAAHCLVVIFVSSWLVFCAQANSTNDLFTYRGGFRNSIGNHRLKEKELKRVLEGLAAKTGFRELHFDADGFLTLGDRRNFVGGSDTARQLLMDAVDGASQLLLESHNHSQKVVFANLGQGTMFHNMRTNVRTEHLAIRIDFSDFGKLIGAKEVLASFDLGMTILHELVHGVRKLHDSVNEWEDVGDCERYVNTIRKELGLPERQQYVARSQTILSGAGWAVNMAELQFARTDFRSGKLKTDEYKLTWDVQRVGQGASESIPAALKSITTKKPEQKSTAAVP